MRSKARRRRNLMGYRHAAIEVLEQRRLLHVGVPHDAMHEFDGQYCTSPFAVAPQSVIQNVDTNDDQLAINHGETAAIIPSQLLANDAGGPSTIVGVSDPIGGTVEIRDGVVFFTPDGHGHQRAFDYSVASPNGQQSTATVTLTENDMSHGSPGDQARRDEHRALFDLINTNDATNVAIASGEWSDPSIWSSGSVPVNGDRVLIHHTVNVEYDLHRDQPLDWLRVDGELNFRTDIPTRIVVETVVSDPRGIINVGSAAAPIQQNVSAEILIDTTGGPLDPTEDPTLVGRGFISHGRTSIYGAEKSEFTTLYGDASAGDNFIELIDSTIPDGWQIGDTLLLAGTEVDASLLNSPSVAQQIQNADVNNERFRDEILIITNFSVVDGRTRVFFRNVTNSAAINSAATTLLWNHERPEGTSFDADELSIHVANLTRNVVFRSVDPDVGLQERGHFMVMHNPNADIHHAQFRDLGRTDKRQIVDDPAAIGNFDGTPGTGTNPRGRYGLHLHRLGANHLDGPRASVTGNVVWGAPGWGIVHHDSHANLEDNVVFDVVGAGIVAEDGNELGLWRNNLVVKTTGDLVNNFDDGAFFQTLRGPRFDLGFFGSGYWLQGGGFGIRLEDNTAVSSNAAGFDLVHHTDGLANVEYMSVDLIEDDSVRETIADAGFEYVTPNNVPTRGIDGLVSYNGFRGIHTWLHNRDSGDMEGTFSFPIYLAHHFRSTIENYTLWGVQSGIQNFYSTRFDFVNGLVVGDVEQPVPLFIDPVQQGNNSTGIGVGHNHEEANHNRFIGLRLEGFEYGFQSFSPFNEVRGEVTPYATSEIRSAQFANVEHAFIPTNAFNPASQQHRFSDLFVIDESSTFSTTDSSNQPPIAAFGHHSMGGLSVHLDASASFDVDPSPEVRSGDDGIVAYAWDLDQDGQYDDAYGQSVVTHFAAAGNHLIGLRVWDDDGAIASTTQIVSASETPTNNPFVDSSFSDTSEFGDQFYRFNSGRRGNGWIARDARRNPNGFAEIGTPAFGIGNLAQVVRDQSVHRGQHIFSFDSRSIDGMNQSNLLQVRLFGVDGQFDLDQQGEPSPIGAMESPHVVELVNVNVAADQSPDWTTSSFDIDLGAGGYEYLVIAIQYAGFSIAQGDYFALDNFNLESTPTIDTTPPSIESVVINEGDQQRSRITELAVQFSESLDAFDENSFVLTNVSTDEHFSPTVVTQVVGGRTLARLTFEGMGLPGNSLPDGRYRLTMLAANLIDGAGNQLDGNRDGQGGDDANEEFFRLFGDIDGDGLVGTLDFFRFRDAFGPHGVFDEAFDANGDDTIDILDFFQFRSRFGTTI